MRDIFSMYFDRDEKYIHFADQNSQPVPNRNTNVIRIRPLKGYVIKTYEKNGDKIYINICFSRFIPDFHVKTFPHLQNEEGLRIPISIGEEKKKQDRTEKTYGTYDVVLNSRVVSECLRNEKIKTVVSELVLEAVKNKYKLDICTSLFLFSNHKYKGNNPDVHYIKCDQQHNIREVVRDYNAIFPGKDSYAYKLMKHYMEKYKNIIEKNPINRYGYLKEHHEAEALAKKLIVTKPQWDMWFIPTKILEDMKKGVKRFFIPYIRIFPLKGVINGLDFKCPNNKDDKEKELVDPHKKRKILKSFFEEYNVELDDEFLKYQDIIKTVCVFQIPLYFFSFLKKKIAFDIDIYNNLLSEIIELWISDECLYIQFKNSPYFQDEKNPPYKSFSIRFPYYYDTSKAIAQFLYEFNLLNIIVPVSKLSSESDVFNDNQEDSDFSDKTFIQPDESSIISIL
ncbi:PIH1 domain-containing protein, putative [Plasmodium sp. gorilla clade G2]|uniref:PIH1 domain-containing protein, putative n=1 Tax=Plasmodium sp. gorilla clade G2 TaxID=880535 RepID=UPI000D22097B|nr:PIH1 domain-containing protein, putative [Plasmodium sp. gorilla clade G2]SOV16996.1 PIH1 domain-containing protein, putative [Plasmodium sp. gorilla clade G2]